MKEFIKKNFNIIIVFLMLLVLMVTCSQNSKLGKMQKNMQTIKDSTYTKTQIDKKFEVQKLNNEINGYKISYRMLYDNNSVIRTKERPDDIMNNYVTKINQLETRKNEILGK